MARNELGVVERPLLIVLNEILQVAVVELATEMIVSLAVQ